MNIKVMEFLQKQKETVSFEQAETVDNLWGLFPALHHFEILEDNQYTVYTDTLNGEQAGALLDMGFYMEVDMHRKTGNIKMNCLIINIF